MMRGFLKKTALTLLPLFVHALVLPNEILESELQRAPSGHIFDLPQYGGPSTFIEYDIDDHSIKFSIPCPECSDEEKELLRQEIISIKPTLQDTASCTSADPIGLEIDGKQVISNRESIYALQSYVGPFNPSDHPEHHILNRTRWINHCGCIGEHGDEGQCNGHFESAFSFEVLGLASGQTPGFTLSYKQDGAPELVRVSTFPDIAIADSRGFGLSSHYRSPLLRVQKAPSPRTILASLSPSSSPVSPSATASASSPSYSYFERIHKAPTVESENSRQSPILDVAAPIPTELKHCAPGYPSTCRFSDAIASLGHGLEAVGMKAKSGAQAILGKIQPVQVPKTSLPTASPFSSYLTEFGKEITPAAVAHGKFDHHDTVAHDEIDVYDDVAKDELGDDYTQSGQSHVDDFLMLEIPSSSWKVNNSACVKAFQVTSCVFIIVALAGSLTALACRNPRIRARWATILEERRNQRLFRQAVRKQRFQTFIGRFRLSSAAEKADAPLTHTDSLDWEEWEKRLSVENSRSGQRIDNEALRQDLQEFRKAHQFVDGLISTNGGRSSSSRQTHRVRRQRTWSFGSEKTAPPAYESENEDLVLDADGPRYVFLGRGYTKSNTSPDSSVVSTSPRTSCADSDSEPDEKF